MLKIKDLNKYEITLKGYKGHSGSKIGLKINGENYLVKFPKIDMEKIKELFLSILLEYQGEVVFSKLQKELYYKMFLKKFMKN